MQLVRYYKLQFAIMQCYDCHYISFGPCLMTVTENCPKVKGGRPIQQQCAVVVCCCSSILTATLHAKACTENLTCAVLSRVTEQHLAKDTSIFIKLRVFLPVLHVTFVSLRLMQTRLLVCSTLVFRLTVVIVCNSNVCFSEAKASVPGASNKLGGWVHNFSPWVRSAMEAAKETIWHKGSLGDEDEAWTLNTCIARRKCAIPHSTMKMQHMTSVLITALGNQPDRYSDGAL